MTELPSVVVFFLTTIGLSFLVDRIAPLRLGWFDGFVVRVGLGIGVTILLALVLDLLSIPLDIRILGAIAAVSGTLEMRARRARARPERRADPGAGPASPQRPSAGTIVRRAIVVVLFLVTAKMYVGGSFRYGYLEDGDPWKFTAVAKVISEEKTYRAPYRYNQCAEPYPQGYPILMGLIHQTNDSIYATMKLFHNLILALGILFFYVLAKAFFRDEPRGPDLAVVATVALFAIPSWVSHFIFALGMNMTLLVVALLTLVRLRASGGPEETRAWTAALAVLTATLLVTHAYTAVVAAAFAGIFLLADAFTAARLARAPLRGLAIGLLLSLVFFVPSIARHPEFLTGSIEQGLGGYERILAPIANAPGPLGWSVAIAALVVTSALAFAPGGWPERLARLLRPLGPRRTRAAALAAFVLGSAALLALPRRKLVGGVEHQDLRYGFADFFQAPAANQMPNPTGWGPLILGAVCAGVLLALPHLRRLDRASFPLLFALLGGLFAFAGVHGERLSIQLFAHRMWTFLAPFACLLAAWGVVRAAAFLPGRALSLGATAVLAGAIVVTSFPAKYRFNVETYWPEHHILERNAYPVFEHVRTALPSGSSVLWLGGPAFVTLGYDAYPPIVDPEISPAWGLDGAPAFHERFATEPLDRTHAFLRERRIGYVLLGYAGMNGRSEEEASVRRAKVAEMLRHPGFEPVARSDSDVLFAVR